MKQEVTFETNVPVELCLAYPKGKTVQGVSGDEVMYTLSDHRMMLVPPTVRDQISKLDLKTGERFTICKREVNDQGRVSIQWVVTRAHSESKAVENIQQRLKAAGLILTHCSRLTNHTGYQLCFATGEIVNVFDTGRILIQGKNEARVRELLDLETAAKGEDSRYNNEASAVNNTGERENSRGAESPPKNNGAARMSYVMQMALQGALEATIAVEQYAERLGILDRNGDPFRFSNADIRAIGLSMFIESRKRTW